MLPCREPACFLVNLESSADHRAAIEHVASMKWSAASISRTRTSMSRTCTSTSRTKASAWRTCRERQRSCRCLRLKRYNVRVIRAAKPVCRRTTERGKILNPEYNIFRDQPIARASPLRINTLLYRVCSKFGMFQPEGNAKRGNKRTARDNTGCW